MNIVENKYHSTIKVEFRDLVSNIVNSNRSNFHMYTIHRLLSLGLLVDFPFQYVKTEQPDKCIGLELDLKEHGKVIFLVDLESNYGCVANETCKENLQQFSNDFDTCIEEPENKGSKKWFRK